MLALLLTAIVASSPLVTAAAPVPSSGVAVVDGKINEWNLEADFFTNMYLSGQSEDNIILSKLYLRYDLITHTLFVLVLTADNSITMIIDKKNQVETYFKIGNEIKVSSPESENFKWVNPDSKGQYAMGFEASFTLLPGTYDILVHANVAPQGKSETSSTLKAGMLLDIVVLPEPGSIFAIASVAGATGLFAAYKSSKKN